MGGTPTWIRWQLPMLHVLIGLIPIVLSAVYSFGWRALLMLLVVNAAGFLTELAFARPRKQPVTSAVFVSATLLGLSLPPALPLWMAVVGVVVGIAFGKMVFGGFGRNVFNPALTGRAFLYVSFGGPMTAQWSEPIAGRLGGFVAYSSDAMTAATPGMLMKGGVDFPLTALLMGHVPGVLGGASVIYAAIGGLYILWRKAANYRIVVSGLAGFLAMQTLLWLGGARGAAPPLHAMLAGALLFGLLFYATDPVSAAQTQEGRWLYGGFIGVMSSLIGVFSAWPAGTMFAILLANMVAPITDHAIRAVKANREQRAG
jgi:Na+-transporting NADH:ubiquinone oxidoreductase subunit B